MEFASHMKHEGIKANVRWAPRETNREADRLANGDHAGFDPALRAPIDVERITWYVLPEALSMGREAEQFCEYSKKAEILPGTARREKRKRQDERLKFAKPW